VAASGTRYEESRLAALDGLRGIAVLLVLWYHIWEISWLPAPLHALQFLPETGFVGVHLFFFLSGFVIAYPFVRSHLRGSRPASWRHFAWRRCVKIVPSYLLSIAVAYAIGYQARQVPPASPQALIEHLLFVHTWFPDSYGAINGVLWTLSVEVEFYLLFPIVWWCFSRAPWFTAAAMAAISLTWRAAFASCCYSTLFTSYAQNLPGYLGIFACGMIAVWIYCRTSEGAALGRYRAVAPLLALGGVTLLVALLENLYANRFVDQWDLMWELHNRELLGIAFAIVALGVLWSPKPWQWPLANRLLIFFGTISYNLYLYHQMLARELLWNRIPPYQGPPHGDARWQLWYTIAAFALTVVQAAFVTYLFERPLLRLPDPSARRALTKA
jgi:peptidoglycan/LPS O-acetylase OafA/YrhL